MDYGAAGKIQGAFLEQETGGRACGFCGCGIGVGIRTRPIPDHVRQRQVGASEPNQNEQQYGGELDPFGEGADDQGGGDGGKRQLEGDVGVFGDINAFAESRRQGFRGDAA